MTEEEFMKMRTPKPSRPPAPKPPKRKPPKPPAPKPPKRNPPKPPTAKPKAAPPRKKKPRYNPFSDGRTPTGASYTTGP